MTQKGNLAAVCFLVLLLELTSLVPGQQCSSTYQPIPGQPGRDGRDGNDGLAGRNGIDGSPGRDGRDGLPAVFTHEDFLKLKEMLINEGVCCSQNSSTPSPSTTVTQTCPTPPPEVQKDCQEFHSNGFSQSGVYTIRPDSLSPFDVYCDMDTDGGGWTVWQRRQDGSVGFYRNWDNYTAGFGDLCGEFWLGLDKINRLTNASSSELRVDLGDFENETAYANYSSFQVGDASTNYTLTVSGYSGTAGDSLDYSNSRPFTTYDQDNDAWSDHCAIKHKGGWWYNSCAYANLNGQYVVGEDSVTMYASVYWDGWRDRVPGLRFSEMKVRPSN